MSFKVNWNSLETEALRNWTKELMTEALNSGKRPNVLASDVQIKDLNFGKIPPSFEILEIGELDKDRFRGIFKINYDGDFHLTLHTKVQANPLNIYNSNCLDKEVNTESSRFITPDFLLSSDPFALPLDLKLSDIKINGIGIIVFSKTKGLTLVFRNDPLDSIKVSSTFDTVQVLANFLQNLIENQIRDLFRETLPTLIHQLSLKYTSINQNDLLNLHSKLSKSYETNVLDLNLKYSSNSLKKNLDLFNSRDTLKLNIPKFKNTIQRTRLDKFNKSLPNLYNSLQVNLNLSGAKLPFNSNEIPMEMLVNHDINTTEDILSEISSIQSTNYYKSNSNNPQKPKRRSIKIRSNRSLNSQKPTEPVTPLQSETSTLVDVTSSSIGSPLDLKQPIPMRIARSIYEEQNIPIHSHSHFQNHMNSPSTNSSLLSGVGLGNNYFNFTTSEQISTSTDKHDEKDIKHKKSINYIDIKKIKGHNDFARFGKTLEDTSFNEKAFIQKEMDNKHHVHRFGTEIPPPPPYYQA